ncbi:hypothetical protein M9H77_27458 [Catharanthus roseus]|uniref:Uncharacterized protein n=1 Tax=Catharanthus roseus TaxID=4058 RepID=A0ACC0AE80_CATRO|nr:hypothetical protein M9H77_27458 [Catharanthus roseus]
MICKKYHHPSVDPSRLGVSEQLTVIKRYASYSTKRSKKVGLNIRHQLRLQYKNYRTWIADVQANPLALRGSFDYSQLPTHTLVTYRDQLDLMPSDQLRGNDHTYLHQWRLRVRDDPTLAVKVLSYPNDEYIRWYRETTVCTSKIQLIVIPVRLDTSLLGVDRRMMTSMLLELDDMASVIIQEPPLSSSQMAIFAKKVQTIIWRVYIENSSNRDTRSVGYQHARVDRRMMTSMLQEVDDMVVSSDTGTTFIFFTNGCFCEKKVQTIIWRNHTFIFITDGCFCEEDDHLEVYCIYWWYFVLHSITARYPTDIPSTTVASPSPGACTRPECSGVKRGAHRQPGRGAEGGRLAVPPFPGRPGHADLGHVDMERGEESGQVERCEGRSGTLRAPLPPGLGFAPFQSPAGISLRFSLFHAPPPDIVGSSTPHQPISQASSSHDEEQTDNTDNAQHLGFRNRVGKKMRFTPSD